MDQGNERTRERAVNKVIIMRKLMMIGILGIMAHLCGPSWHSAAAQNKDLYLTFPKACYFFAPQKVNPNDLPDERAYETSFSKVYFVWCTSNHSTLEQKRTAADMMVKQWKVLWDRDEPFNAAFHEEGALELLELMGLTHELPALMRTDPSFTREWIESCSYVCFHLGYDGKSADSGRNTLMQLWLRNDVLDNLKKEPAAEPVFKMLEDAKFTLVD
jgi:hypothetical protein